MRWYRKLLRVGKKGGCFAFQDLFEKESLYGDMTDFLSQLRQAGVQELHYIPHVERQGFIPRYVQAPSMLSERGPSVWEEIAFSFLPLRVPEGPGPCAFV